MTLFRHDPAVLERFPTTSGGVVHAVGVSNGSVSPGLGEAFRAEQERTLERIGDTPLAELPSLAAWRRVFSGFGVEPTRYRSAVEALLRRLTKQGELPSVSPLVDLGNLVSIRHALPVAVLDLAAVTGAVTVRFARGDEPFTDLGSEVVESPAPGEVVFVDEGGLVHARRWCWRQSAQSATTAGTTEILVTVEGHHPGARDDVRAALTDLEQLVTEHAGARTVSSRVVA